MEYQLLRRGIREKGRRSLMKCSMCENNKALKKSFVTVKYKASGLDNVTLTQVEHYKCEQCGEEYFKYGDLEKLLKGL